MLIKSSLSKEMISNTLDAIECALIGQPHMLIVTPEQRRLRLIGHRTAFYPKQPAAVSEQPIKENNMGYGEGRYMGD